ncbi:HNH endonuclease signature motif containing protein [Agrococcus jenensis]|uniref:HNH endonuclease n=1 Tax=Agrococcus jenensis TaxID=46353 RepID=A0A3N2AQN2_9MICO|nr:HNH endonuclease signature motif containing protein [Agrococcus jenensis]ROR65347.1 HNH endonuclease [Agrococcus jenensis]
MTSTEQARTAVVAARALLAEAPSFSTTSDAEVAELLGRVAELARIAESLQVRLAHEVEERSHGAVDEPLCLRLGARHVREAVARAFGLGPRRALDLLLMGRATSPSNAITGAPIAARYPAVAGALAGAEISFAQAHAIVATIEPAAPRAEVEQLATAEQLLVEAATDPATPLPPEQLIVLARRCAALLDPDGVLPNDEQQRALRSLRIRQQRDGSWLTVIRSPAEDGSAIKAVVDAYTGPRVKVAFHDEHCDHGGCSGADCSSAEHSLDDRSPEQKAHDALVAMVKAHAASGDAPLAGGESPSLVLTGTIEAYGAYVQGVRCAERTLTIEHTSSLVPIEHVDQLVCFADLHHLVVDEQGHPLWLGRTQRLFTRAQKRALAKRDKGCRVPGCGMPVAWCETHHIVPWQDGGATDVDNGILVCSYHHHEIHAGRLRVEKVGRQPGSWRIVPQLQAARQGRDASAMMSIAAAFPTATGAPGSLGATAPASLAVKLPEPVGPRIEPHTRASVESNEPRSSECVTRPRRRPRAAANASGGSAVGSTERRIRTLLHEHGRARQHRGRADRPPRISIVLRR